MNCHFCDYPVSKGKDQQFEPTSTTYDCPICGVVRLTSNAADGFEGERFTANQKNILSIVFRNEYERRNRKFPETEANLEDLQRYIREYRPLSSLEKLDYSLLKFEKTSNFIGHSVHVNPRVDYAFFHCLDPIELRHILAFLLNNKFICPFKGYDRQTYTQYDVEQIGYFFIDQKGYERLRELEGVDSNVGFVAMWYQEDMASVYRQAIKPAIEFIEDGASEPRFRAVRVDNVEHVNNINDEIIAQIRRSKFMVCDLTGYRGGVYFEAGFAHGLGLPVIYTCRKDWCEEDQLRDATGKPVEYLKDSIGRSIQVRKEGVHFDLAHQNRIEWDFDKLDVFRENLRNRIRAVII